jgi:hypothetical protein
MNNQETKKTWWPLILAFFNLSCVPFLFIGKKCKNWKWIIYGILYLVLLVFLFALNSKYEESTWYLLLVMTYCVFGIVHTYLNIESFAINLEKVKLLRDNPPSSIVTIVKPLELYSMTGDSYGKMMKPILYLLLPIWLLGCLVALLLVVFVDHNVIVGICSLVGLIMGIVPIFALLGGGKYEPEKSFYLWRLSKEDLLKIKMYFTGAGVLIFVMISLIDFKVQNILYLISALAAFYYISKSFKYHEDVDFVTNNEVSDLLGMEIDEKVQASYQNFSPESVKKGSNMMLLTDKKLLFAFFDGGKWSLINKKLKDICKIGRINTDGVLNLTSTSSFLYIVFSDGTNIGLHMDLCDKITSNPDLFFKKFLTTFDAIKLGKTDEKIASRRRVSVNNDPKPSVSDNNGGIDVRTIDISDTILGNLRDATPIESGRTLEF